MKQLKYFIKTALCLAVLIFAGCEKETSEGEELDIKINSVIPPEFVKVVQDLGIEIHRGTTPPLVEGTFNMNPNLLLSTNIPGDVAVNTGFVAYRITFFDQSSENNAIKFNAVASGESEASNGAVISGSDNNFTVYGRSTVTVGANSVVLGVIYSGKVEGNSIKNLKRSIVCIDDSKNGGVLLSNGMARVFHDPDKDSPKIP
jgi:hypothetical protein